ncbi:MAG: tandem-95 repeat protein, partial [Sterolibacteriaceae bacterium]|nr:tandem-95 repeat protein [Sterolibacteriaceae bacterium]
VNTSEAPSTATRTVAFVVNDGAANSNTGTRAISVAAVNDAPLLTTSGSALAHTENVPATAIDPALTVNDVDNANVASATVSISANYAAGQDVLAFTNQNGISGNWNVGTGVLTLSGSASVANYQTALRSITYVNTSEAPSTATRTVSFLVNDGAANSNSATRSISMAALNDAPVLTGANNLNPINEDPASNPGTLVSALMSGQVSDVDSGALTGIAVTVVDNSNGNWQYTTDGGSSWTAFDTPTAGSARLLAADAMTSVRFVPNANWNGTLVGGLTFRAWDRTFGSAGGTADAGTNGGSTAFSSAAASAGITVASVNDAPSGADNTIVIDEDTARTFIAADFGFSDPNDSPPNTLNGVRISTLPGAGALMLSGAAVSAGQMITVANINAGLLVFTPAPNASGSGYASFTFQVRDNGGTANGGINLNPTPNTMTVNVSAVNDAPIISAPAAQATAFNTALVLSTANGNPISVADVDAGGADLEVTLNATNGTLILAGVAGLNFSAGGNGSSSMSFTGSLASINAALDGMIFAPSSNFSGAASVSVLANDQGNSGAGGPRGAGRSLAITVQASTSLVITDDTRATAEDTVLNAASVLANDSDPAAGTLTVSAVNGNSAAIGSTVVLASGATLAMNADGTFVYNPNGAFAALAMGSSALDSFSYDVSSTSGSSGSATVWITVNGANDAPALAGANALNDITEDVTGDNGTLVSALIAGRVSDADSGALAGVAITAADNANGTWQYTIDGGTSWVAFGTPTVADARLLAVDALTSVRFVPNPNWNGTVASGLTLRAWDRTSGSTGGTADTTGSGGSTAFSVDEFGTGITVTPVSDAPSGANRVIGIDEDTAHVFGAADFGFSDSIDSPADALAWVHIDTLPAAGALTNNGVPLSAGQAIAVADIIAGKLVFTPGADGSGAAYASFTFRVQDDGGTANGGADSDPIARTVMSNVNGVNDAPVLTTSGGTLAYTENDAATVIDSALTVNDVDNGNLSSATVTISTNYAAGQDLLAFVNQNGISGSWNAGGGVLTLTGNASVANYQTALRSITYVNTSEALSTATRTVSFVVNDSAANSNTAARSISMAALNDAPVLSASGGTLAYTENDAATAIDPALTVGDVDNANLTSATVSISANYAAGQDLLSFVNQNGISGSWNAGTGVLTLTGSATVANYETALRSITYVNTSEAPSTALRSVSFVVNDGTADSTIGTRSISVAAVNDAPTATNLNAAETYVEDTPLNLTDIVVSDLDSANVSVSLTVSDVAAGSLNTGTAGAVSSTYNAGTGVWSAGGAIGDVNALLAGLSFTPAANYNSSFSIATSVSDGVAAPLTGTKNMTGTAVSDAPTATNLNAPETYVENTPLNLTDIVVSDLDSANVSVTLTLSDVAAGSLNTGTAGAVSSTYVAGTGVWSASGAIADVNALLAGLTFAPAGNYNSSFSISISVSDGVAAPLTGTKNMTGTAVNDAPKIASPIADQTAIEDRTFSFTVPAGSFTDIGAGDTLSYSATLTSGGGLPAWLSFDAGTRTFNGTPANGDVGTLSIRVTATDGGGLTASDDFTLTVANVNDAPVLTSPVSNQSATQDSAFLFALPPGIFTDIDAGDTLSYSASLLSGAALPSWLSFNAASQTFSGTPSYADVGTHTLFVTATDSAGAAAHVLVAITVSAPAPAAPAPAVPAAPFVIPSQAPIVAPAESPPPAAEPRATNETQAAAAPVAPVSVPHAATVELLADDGYQPTSAEPSHRSDADVLVAMRLSSRADSVLADVELSQLTSPEPASFAQMLTSEDMRRRFEEMRHQLDEAADTRRNIIASGAALSGGLSIGYVIWLVRGGVLASAMLSALPAWQMIDPLPVLAATRKRGKRESDEPEVERLFDKASRPVRAGEAGAAGTISAKRIADHRVATAPTDPGQPEDAKR